MKEKFKKFLEENQAYDKFVENLNNKELNGEIVNRKDLESFDDYVEDTVIPSLPSYLIIEAFVWDNFDLWNNLNSKWVKFLENEKTV